LFQLHKLFLLHVKNTFWYIVLAEGHLEFFPSYLMIGRLNGHKLPHQVLAGPRSYWAANKGF
jgi:hypothetical protein